MPAFGARGDLDSTFGGTGKIGFVFGFGSNRAFASALQPDGKIIVAGETSIGSFAQIAVLRYKTDGSLDSTFGTNGIVITRFGTIASSAKVSLSSRTEKLSPPATADFTTWLISRWSGTNPTAVLMDRSARAARCFRYFP